MESNPRVSCIIVNWNGWQDTIECLDALKRCTYPRLEVVVVDNGSTNDSVARIKTAHPDTLLFESGGNLGFSGGNNIGIRHALAQGAEYIWLLNNDTTCAPDALTELVKKALSNPRIGAVGSVCYYADQPDTVQIWGGGRVNLWIGYGLCNTEPQPDHWFQWLNGASILLATQAIQQIGLLDEGFFLYWEDTEYCLRLSKSGWQLAVAGDSHVLHKVSASYGNNSLFRDRYFTASDLRILRLYAPVPSVAMFLFLAARFLRRLVRFRFSSCKSVWAGIQDYRRSSLAQKIR